MEPVAIMGVLVGATRRVKIGAAVLILPSRNPLLLARMMVTLDQFSGGRMILGAGTGWLEEEFDALGAHDFKKRGRVTDEYIEIFKAVPAGGEVGYRGQTYSFAPVVSNPGSVQRPHPSILIGGLSGRLFTGWPSTAAAGSLSLPVRSSSMRASAF
jgi:alkanesulfonate monooxygenase SsuD/methylene tetrahydromethanopterin reductase-like flavin-dependent oxidoreductase (luciferase family)